MTVTYRWPLVVRGSGPNLFMAMNSEGPDAENGCSGRSCLYRGLLRVQLAHIPPVL